MLFYSFAQLALEKYEDAQATLQKADSLNSMNFFLLENFFFEVCKVHGVSSFIAMLSKSLPTDS